MSAPEIERTAAEADGTVSLRRMPRWYTTLFVTDTLERFGFYGMQAILVLYAAAPPDRGGLGLRTADAGALFGAWISVMFLLSLPGGWIGDRLLGQWRALLCGCVLSGAGYLALAAPTGWATAAGLILLAAGGALFKPNHQALINLMFDGRRGRESGISLMYVGVQVSALAAPLVTGYLGEKVSWHLGFSVASAAVLATALLLVFSARQFGGTGMSPRRPASAVERRRALRGAGLVLGAAVVLVAVLAVTGRLSATAAIMVASVLSIVLPVAGYVTLYRNPALTTTRRRRLRGYLAVCLGATLFWIIIAHSASLLTLFARDHTDLTVFGLGIPASWLQAATPAFILLLAPVVAAVLPNAGGVAAKLGAGLLMVGAGFLVMCLGSSFAEDGERVSLLWLALVYLLHAAGEVIIAAVAISSAADVLGPEFVGRVLGMLWLFAALGGGLGSMLVRLSASMSEPVYYAALGGTAVVVGVVFLLSRRTLGAALASGSEVQKGHV
ncbi:peptide MFS transporter [Amycolatopsis rifamycinica]|uniref:Peptide permease n=1 Tax=Amycolatopsis rifamycinica TaxID=287986 RepID=A0A066U801_9PSEU|nr:oligopeptide:H+ symporter [Amycolatopsis rifamycinica]KDN20358.1 peptide permease [Amycolatopsis rifamycinica]